MSNKCPVPFKGTKEQEQMLQAVIAKHKDHLLFGHRLNSIVEELRHSIRIASLVKIFIIEISSTRSSVMCADKVLYN